MIEKKAAIIGATGMTGNDLLTLLLQDDYFSTVRVIVRRPMQKTGPKMEVKLVDFSDAESLKLALEDTSTLFCCIGTTQKKVKGDKELYREIDLGIPLRAARFAKEAGCEQFIIVSATGANSHSSNFYLKLKGEMEEMIRSVGIKSVDILRPSMLLGDRKESRPSERFFQSAMKIFSFLIPEKYKAIESKSVAKAMLTLAKQNEPGFHVHDNSELRAGL